MRIAFFGDVVGAAGMRALAHASPILRNDHGAELLVANAENAANGSGLTPELYKKCRQAGIDGVTLGDHVFKKAQIVPALEREAELIRPCNLPGGAAGRGMMTLRVGGDEGEQATGPPIVVISVMGRLFMNQLPVDEPFAAIDRALASIGLREACVIVEVHAEATSEKIALGWHLNGRVAAVVGTHTHVPTADARVLPMPGSDPTLPGEGRLGVGDLGTAYITDLGMTGPKDSVLGRRADRVVKHMSTAMHAAFDVAEGR
ncbi:MAG: TIGR00282 family metallophosphoesterase, partial [Phycisphaeraceae bacterium]